MSQGQQGAPATADVCDAMEDDATVCEVAFRDYGAHAVFSGTIVTVATFEDNLNLREVLAGDGAGKVLVVDGGASIRRALVGGNVAQLAAEKGWAGLVINGCVRDAHEIAVPLAGQHVDETSADDGAATHRIVSESIGEVAYRREVDVQVRSSPHQLDDDVELGTRVL